MELVYAVAILLFLLWLQRIIFEKRSFRNLEYTCRFSTTEATEGDELQLQETVINRKALPLPWLRSELVTSRWLEYADSTSLVTDETRFVTGFFSLKGWQKITRSWHVRCGKRGVFPVEKCVLLTTDLTGRMNLAKPVSVGAELVVLPKPADLTQELVNVRSLSGDVTVRRHFVPDPFRSAGVRERQDGDPMNRIHWASTARLGRVMVRSEECTSDQELLLIINMQSRSNDTNGIADPDRIEKCIRIAAGYAEDTLRTGIPLRMAVNAPMGESRESLVTGQFAGREHVLDLMRTLARLPMAFSEPTGVFLDGTLQPLQASDIVLVTACLNEKIFSFVRERRERGSRVRLVSPVAVNVNTLPEDIDVTVLREALE